MQDSYPLSLLVNPLNSQSAALLNRPTCSYPTTGAPVLINNQVHSYLAKLFPLTISKNSVK